MGQPNESTNRESPDDIKTGGRGGWFHDRQAFTYRADKVFDGTGR